MMGNSEVGDDVLLKIKKEVENSESLDALSSADESISGNFHTTDSQTLKRCCNLVVEQPLKKATKQRLEVTEPQVEKPLSGATVQSISSLSTEETWNSIKIENASETTDIVTDTDKHAADDISMTSPRNENPKQFNDRCGNAPTSQTCHTSSNISLLAVSQNWELTPILEILTKLLNHAISLHKKLGENPPPEFLSGDLENLVKWGTSNSLAKSPPVFNFTEDKMSEEQKSLPVDEICSANGRTSVKTEFHENYTWLIECPAEDKHVQSEHVPPAETWKVRKNSVKKTCKVVPEHFECRLCAEKVPGREIIQHFIKFHPKGKECIFCGKRSATHRKADLQKHMLLHTGDKPYSCEFCNVKFAEKGALRKHTEVHLGERRFQCDICDKKFNRNEHLKTHILSAHSNERPFECNICQSTFNRYSTLKQHLTSHTKDKKYECEQCHLKVSSTSDLSKHMRVHTGEKPYRCKHCDKRFSWSGSYQNHLRLHEELQDFGCAKCDLQFPSKQSLNAHNRVHREGKNLTSD